MTKSQLLIVVFIGLFGGFAQATTLYWIGGSGNWTNPSKWSFSSGGPVANVIPNSTSDVIFDGSSGLVNGSNIVIPAGIHETGKFLVQSTTPNFNFLFNGANGTTTEMNVHGQLSLLSTHGIVYGAATSDLSYIWKFHGQTSGNQRMKTGGQNLRAVYFLNENVTYELNSPLLAGKIIRLFGGTLITNSQDITTSLFLARDDSSPDLIKHIDAGTTTFDLYEFDALFAYGSLTMSGNYSIKANVFIGQSTQANGPTSIVNDVYLKDYDPSSSLSDNNFVCTNCEVDKIIVENTHDTRFAGNFIVKELFEVQHQGATVVFNNTQTYGDVITMDGNIITPAHTNCIDERTKWISLTEDNVYFKRTIGTLLLKDSEVKNIKTTGGANFNLDNGIMSGNSEGWNEINSPVSLTYIWTGMAGDSLWSNPGNWTTTSGTNSCLPTLNDNVMLNNPGPVVAAHIVIPANYAAYCKDLSRTSILLSATVYLRGTTILDKSTLSVSGDLNLPPSVFFDVEANSVGNKFNQLILNANQPRNISCGSVLLPETCFLGELGTWTLQEDFECDRLSFFGGTFNTNNKNILVLNDWVASETTPKIFNFSSSNILVHGKISLGNYFTIDVTLDAGTSTIEAEILESLNTDFYNFKSINPSNETLFNTRYQFNKLILAGADLISSKTIEADSIVFESDGVTFSISENDSLIVNEGILSLTASGAPGKIHSSATGVQRTLFNNTHNLCVEGPVEFQDINAAIYGVCHTPIGLDAGNNMNINFSNSTILTPLYWIGRQGDWDVRENWSNLSGGCPVNKNPNTALRLIFDENSFFSSEDTVKVPILTNCKTLDFYNSTYPAIIDIQTRMNPLQIFINAADVFVTGAKMFVQTKTEIRENGRLNINITEGIDPKYDTELLRIFDSGLLEIENNTKVIVRE